MLCEQLPTEVYPASAIRQHEAQAAADCSIAMYQLMERAGSAVFEQLKQLRADPGRLLVLCGKGNNGGDGYVLARLAKAAGWHAVVAQVGEPEQLNGDAARAMQAWRDCAGELLSCESLTEHDWQVDVIADGLLGTGLCGDTRPPFAQLIAMANRVREQTPARVLAIDIPSGLCADTGRVLGDAVVADATVSFVGLKAGLLTHQACEHVGQLVFTDLGIGEAFACRVKSTVSRVWYQDWEYLLTKPRSRNSHKGDFGRVLLVGGNEHMPGAIRLAGEACLRTGAGLVKLAAHERHGAELIATRPELMLSAELGADMRWADVLVLGPGLGRDAWGESRASACLSAEQPRVIDADGLYWLSKLHANLELPSAQPQWVLTPHSGEAARLLGCSSEEVNADRLGAAQQIARQYGGVCVLKGPGTVISSQEQTVIAEQGNPGMASGGMGDVLSGIIAGLLGQSQDLALSLFDAAALGVSIHAHAAELAVGKQRRERGLLATDLMPHIRKLVNPSHVALSTL